MGFGTTHKVNNLILQGTFGDKSYPTISYLKRKGAIIHSFLILAQLKLATITKKCGSSSTFFPRELVRHVNSCSMTAINVTFYGQSCWKKRTGWRIPSWAGFQILIDSNVKVLVILTASTHIQLRLRCQPLIRYELLLTLGEKCPYSEFFWHLFSRIRTECKEILRIF